MDQTDKWSEANDKGKNSNRYVLQQKSDLLKNIKVEKSRERRGSAPG